MPAATTPFRRTLIGIILATMAVAGCGSDAGTPDVQPAAPTSAAPTAGSETPARATPTATAPTASDAETITYETWMVTQDDLELFVTRRSSPYTAGVAREAVEALLEGPTEFEANAGLGTAIPDGSRLLDISIAERVATVDLDRRFEAPSGTAGEIMRLAQLTFTLTQFPTIEAVTLRIEGEHVEQFGSHGIDMSEPMRRSNFKRYLPPITVTEPAMGDRVGSPVTITGTANVFEATVSLRLVDAAGNELARDFTTATCGSGCRGDFQHTLEFEVTREQHAVLEVWWDSPEDGSPQDMVEIPLTLVP